MHKRLFKILINFIVLKIEEFLQLYIKDKSFVLQTVQR